MKTQEKFVEFVENCVKREDALLTQTNKLFTTNNIKNTIEFLKGIKTLFDEKNAKAKKEKNNRAKTWGIGDIFDGSVFGDDFKDLKEYFANNEVIIEILLHCNWLMYLCSDRQHKQNSGPYKKTGVDEYFKVKTEWAIGPTFSGTSLDAMLFILELILKVKNDTKDIKDSIQEIEKLCNDVEWKEGLKWKESDEKNISTDAIVNVILFLCDNKKYLPIPAQNKKKLISEKLGNLINEEEKKEENVQNLDGMSVIDKDLFLIRKKLRKLKVVDSQKTNPFWHPKIRPFWDDSTENLDKDQLSDKTLLEYKKAMILYGPPGTSKSYQARKMAEGMIADALRIQKNISDAIKLLQDTIDSHIHILQMHPNYTYDDFIIGKSIEDNKIVVKPGKILQIIKGIEKKDTIPHFVILDEINRVDISRVFGELFTAMETSYREEGVELSVNIKDIPDSEKEGLCIKNDKLYLKVPENLYFIGTMNMIDFSLEQVDFALRRRFLWRLSTYDPKRLDEIISEKIYKEDNKDSIPSIPDDFSKTCTDLNNEIEWENSLGKSYLIGHAFFSEIVDIVKQVKDWDWDKAKNILWQVSILPTLEAYCGTMDANMQETFLNNCKEAFIPKPEEKKNK